MTTIHDGASVALFGRNDLLREGLRRILESNGFKVRVADKKPDHFLGDYTRSASEHTDLFIFDYDRCMDVDSERIEMVHDQFPGARVVILHDIFDFDFMIDAFETGVDGYIVKNIPYESLIESLRLVAMGEKVMPSALAGLLPEWGRKVHHAPHSAPGVELLSSREIDTLRCLCRGDPNKVIARELDISEATVKVHVKAILRKLGLRNRTQAAAWSLNAGLDLDCHQHVPSSFAPGHAIAA